MNSKYRILPDRLTDCVTDWGKRQKRDELTAAFLEAYEARFNFESNMDAHLPTGQVRALIALDDAADTTWTALQAHIEEAGQ